MKRRDFNRLLGATTAGSFGLAADVSIAAEANWSLEADVAEACSCEIPCPCNFGLPTKLKCEGSRLLQIRSGMLNDQDLAGINFVVTFEMREWTKIYADEAMNSEQRAAFEAVFPIAFGGFKKLMRSFEYVPLAVERAEDRVRFSVPESEVEIALLRGRDGKPITIDNLPSPAFIDYVQFESVVHRHASADANFSHAETNGFSSRMSARGTA